MNGKDRGLKVAVICALVISVMAIGIGFAAFSETLTIAGTATVKASSWEVKFANLSTPTVVGNTLGKTAKIDTAPTINTKDTTISEYKVTLSNPGDFVTYTFDVVNNGTYDAELTSVNIPSSVTCTGTNTDSTKATTDAANVCKHVTYTLEYATAKSDGSKALTTGDVLKAQESAGLVLKLSYEEHDKAEELPSADVNLSNLGISLVYSQK